MKKMPANCENFSLSIKKNTILGLKAIIQELIKWSEFFIIQNVIQDLALVC
jgi:hypothetical protein